MKLRPKWGMGVPVGQPVPGNSMTEGQMGSRYPRLPRASELSLCGVPSGSTGFEDVTKACPMSCQVCDKGTQDLGSQPSLSVQLDWGSAAPPSLAKHRCTSHWHVERSVRRASQELARPWRSQRCVSSDEDTGGSRET